MGTMTIICRWSLYFCPVNYQICRGPETSLNVWVRFNNSASMLSKFWLSKFELHPFADFFFRSYAETSFQPKWASQVLHSETPDPATTSWAQGCGRGATKGRCVWRVIEGRGLPSTQGCNYYMCHYDHVRSGA